MTSQPANNMISGCVWNFDGTIWWGKGWGQPADLEIPCSSVLHFRADPNQYLEWLRFQLAKMLSPLRIEQCCQDKLKRWFVSPILSRRPTVLRLFYLGISGDLHCKPIVQGDLQGRCWGHRHSDCLGGLISNSQSQISKAQAESMAFCGIPGNPCATNRTTSISH